MGFLFVISQAQRWIADCIQPGDITVDATAGNGGDTLFLAQAVGAAGVVYSFDIQAIALENTQARLEAENSKAPLGLVHLIHSGHENMLQRIPSEHHGKIAAIMFNLGFLPGSSQEIITQPSTTLAALETALQLLRSGGLITIVVYPGHRGGDDEAAAVSQWATQVSPSVAQTVIYQFPQKPNAPYLIALMRK